VYHLWLQSDIKSWWCVWYSVRQGYQQLYFYILQKTRLLK